MAEIDKDYIDLRVKEVMAEKGVTVQDLADRIGKHKQYISNIINVGPATSLGSLIMIAKALGIPFRDMFGPGTAEKDDNLALKSSDSAIFCCPKCGSKLEVRPVE